MNKDQIVSILFSDLKGFSKIKDDNLKAKLVQTIENDVKNHILKQDNHFFRNTWGDAFFICSYNPVDLAEIALKMRDEIKNKNWKRYRSNVI